MKQLRSIHFALTAVLCQTSGAFTQTNGLVVSSGHIGRYGWARDMEMSVQLKFGGIASNAFALSNLKVTRAIDDTGKDLTGVTSRFTPDWPASRAAIEDWWQWSQPIRLKHPAKSARMIRRLEGEVALTLPNTTDRPRFTIENFMARPGEPMRDARLEEHGITLIYHTMESFIELQRAHPKQYVVEQDLRIENQCFTGIYGSPDDPPRKSVAIQVDDPQQKLLSLSFEKADGTALKPKHTSSASDFRCYRFEIVPPKDLKLVFSIVPPSVVRTERFSLTNVWLPWDFSPCSPYLDPPVLQATAEISGWRGSRATNVQLAVTFKGGPITNAASVGAVTLQFVADQNGKPLHLTATSWALPMGFPLREDHVKVNTISSPKQAIKRIGLAILPVVESLLWLEGEVEMFHPTPTNGCLIVFPNLLRLAGKKPALPGAEATTTDLRFIGRVDLEQQRIALSQHTTIITSRSGPAENATNSLRFDLWNPNAYVIDLEFRDKSGQPLQPNGRLQSFDTIIYQFREAPRDDWQLVVYLAAPATIQRHPFCAENIPIKVRDL